MPYSIFISDNIIDDDEFNRITKLALIDMIEQYWVGIFDVNTSELIVLLTEINATVLSLRKYTSYNFEAPKHLILETNLKRFDEIYLGFGFTHSSPGTRDDFE